MRITEYLLGLLRSWGLVSAKPARKAAAKRKAKRKASPVSHAEAVKRELMNAVADALGRAPTEINESAPKARIAVNGSVFILPNTVGHLTEFQTRLEKLQTTTKAPGVPLAARKFRVNP